MISKKQISTSQILDELASMRVVSEKIQTVVFDIDGTLLDDSQGSKEYYNPINDVVDIAKYCAKLDYKIIIITARPLSATIASHRNLRSLGIPYNKLIVNKLDEDYSFKSRIRKDISKNNHIVMTIGDKLHDLRGEGDLKILVSRNGYHKIV